MSRSAVTGQAEWEWRETSPITWDASLFGVENCTGNYGRLRDGRVAAEVFVPYDVTTELSKQRRLDSLSGETATGSIVLRRLERCFVEPSTRSHRVLRFQAELAVECPWEGEGVPPGAASFEFDTVEFGIQGMPQWLGVDHGWFDNSPDDEFYIQPKWRDASWPGAEIGDAKVSLRGVPQWETAFPSGLETWGQSRLRIDLPAPLHVSQIEDFWIRPVQRCIELAHRKRSPLTAVWVSRSEWPSAAPTVHDRLWAEVVSRSIDGSDDWHERPLFLQDPLSPRQFEIQVTEAVQWSYPTDQVARSLHSDSEAAVAFAQAVTGLEGLLDAADIPTHRNASWASYLDQLSAAVNSVEEAPTKVRKKVLKELAKQPPRSFEQRLRDLDRVLAEPMESRWGEGGWAADVVTLRNKALHGALAFGQAADATLAFRVAARACQGLALEAWNHVTEGESADGVVLLDEALSRWAIVENFAEEIRRGD